MQINLYPLFILILQDLFSVMILGPEGTPYEDAVFLFDFMLPNDYPVNPPVCHYHSHCSDRLNPNLYEDGKVSSI